MQADAVMQTYARYPLTLVRGRGSHVWDNRGRKYLDFTSGIAVNALGHAHPALAEAVCRQAGTLLHCSNLFHIPQQQELAARLASLAGLERVFFCNSGAEANEAAIKLVRRYWHEKSRPRTVILTARGSFHGRTLATVAATGQDKVKTGFAPLPAGFRHVPFNDIKTLRQAMNAETAAVLLEPVQGEGGVHVAAADYLRDVRKLCDKTGALMLLDEVQTGMGRTGTMFACEQAGVRPDILTLAKGLGGGFPIGAMVAAEKVAAAFVPGTHGSTFGGNPLACTAALTVLDVIAREDLLENVRDQGARLRRGLVALKRRFADIREVRGMGLLLGMEMAAPVTKLLAACRDKGLLLLPAGPKVLRFLPPLNVHAAEIDAALEMLAAAMNEETSCDTS